MSDKTSNSPANYILLTRLADEFAARYRAGDRPSLQEYIDRHPALANDIRELFPAMVEIEQVKEDHRNAAGPAEAPAAPASWQLGDFRILRQVGKGGMGIVYEAEQVSLGRHVALKVLPKNMLLDAQAKRRFEREAKSAAKLHHTNIVPVFGVGEHDGLPYYVMQYIQGLGLDAVLDGLNHIEPGGSTALTAGEVRFSRCGATAAQMARSLMTGVFPHAEDSLGEECAADAVTLGFDAPVQAEDTGRQGGEDTTLTTSPSDTDTPQSARLSDSFNPSASTLSFPGPSSGVSGRKTNPKKETYWHRVANVGRQVADALDYAHKQGILHRDVKPSNLLLDMRGTVWVTDFGLAKVAGPGGDDLTHTGDIVGTLRYMPPESFEGKSDARSDVYSLGLTLYELLAMRPAFAEKDRNKLVKMVTFEQPPRLDKVKPEIPRDLVTIVQKSIEKEPGRRYATAEELAADLQRYIDDEPILARRQTELERCVRWARHNPGIAALCAVLAAVLLTATIVSVIVAGYMAQTAANEERERARAEAAKTIAEKSFAKAREAERLARAAEEEGRKLLYTTDMQLAPFLWRDDRSTAEELRMVLAKHVPSSSRNELRGFEWYYYQHLLEASAAVFSGHGFSVVDGAFTADGQLVTLDQSAQLRRWDLVWQHEDQVGRRDLPDGLEAQIRVLSPDGRLAAVAAGNKVRIFDTFTGKKQFSLDSVEATLRRIIFARDGVRFAIVDDKIRWLSASSGEVIASIDQKFGNVYSVALSGDGLTLGVVGHGGMGQFVSIFRVDASAKTVTSLAKDFGAGGTLSAAALSPDGRWIAVGAKLSGSIILFDTVTGSMLARHDSAHASPIRALAFSDDGTRLATADAEGTIKIWADLQKLNSKSAALLTKKGHQGTINTVRFSADGRRLVTTGADKTARVWDIENSGAAIWPLEASFSNGSFVARFSPDGQLIVAADGNTVRLWDAANGRLVRELSPADKGRIFSVAFSPTDNRLLAVGYGGEDDVSYVALWDIDAGTELARLPGATDLPDFQVTRNSGPVGALAFSPDGKNLVAGFGSKNMLTRSNTATPLKVWEVASRRLIRRLTGPRNYCVSLDFSRDGTLLAGGSRDGTATLWSTATWIKLQTVENPDNDSLYGQSGVPAMIEDVAFSPDGKLLAMASREGTVQLWDVATGKHQTLKGHSGAVSAVVFSPDGRTLASGSHDRTVRLWNIETRRELMQLEPGNIELGYVRTLAFSPDGKRLLVGGNGTAFWATAPNVWNDPNRAAPELRLLLHSNADFRSRIRMLSENLRLHEALAKLDAKDKRVQAALAATEADWHASRKAWPQAVAAFDRLVAVDPAGADAWLRTPGLLRLAMALLQEKRPAVAAALLQDGAKRRTREGLPAVADQVGAGFVYSIADDTALVTELLPGVIASEAGPVPGDTLLKVNDTDLTRKSIAKLGEMLAGEAGTKVRLTVRKKGSDQPRVIELTRARFIHDPATGQQLYPLRAAVNEHLAREPRAAGLLELRAELAGQWSDTKAQAADYSTAIEAISQHQRGAAVADLERLYGRRGNAYVALQEWQKAIDDYARVITDSTTDDVLLSNQALAQAEALLPNGAHVLVPTSEREGTKWRFTTLEPADQWQQPGFNDSDWEHGVGPFGTPDSEKPRTAWTTREIWLRHRFEFAGAGNRDSLFLRVFCDDQAQVFLNGQRVAKRDGIAREYEFQELDQQVRQLLVPGMNTLAVHCKNLSGSGRIDVGLYAAPQGSLFLTERRLAATGISNSWVKLAAAHQIRGDQEAIDRLVDRRPNLAGPVGDLFTQGKDEFKDWRRAISLYNKGITAAMTDVVLLSKRARAHEALKNWDAAAADWSQVAAKNPDGPKLLADFARRLAKGGVASLAAEQFAVSRALYEAMLQADPENDLVVPELANLLWDLHENEDSSHWTVLKPREMKSAGGATLLKLDDDSILASGVNPPSDEYTVAFYVPQRIAIQSIRLEVLLHDSLPGKGPGRSTKGYEGVFALFRWDLTAQGPDGAGPPQLFRFRTACADYSWRGDPLRSIGEWNISSASGKAHTSIWSLQNPVTLEAGTLLRSKMRFNTNLDWGDQNLGRFRISVSGDPAVFDREQVRFAAMKPTSPWLKLAAAYAGNREYDHAARYFNPEIERAPDYEAREPIIELASLFDDLVPFLIERWPDEPQLQVALVRQLASRGKKHLTLKQPAQAQAELAKARAVITRLRENAPEPHWTVLKPTELRSERGTILTLQGDGSILASGKDPNQETYILTASIAAEPVGGLRLETIPDGDFSGGAGRVHGEFFLAEIEAAVSAHSGGTDHHLAINDGFVDFYQPGNPLSNAFDHDNSTSWGVWTQMSEPHTAVFAFQPLSPAMEGSQRFTVRLYFGTGGYAKRNLGRFRLSVTNRAHGLVASVRLRHDFKDGDLLDLNVALAQAHAQQGHIDEAVTSFTDALRLAADGAAKARIVAEAASLAGVLEKLAERAAGDAQFQAELARYYADHGNAALAR